MYHEIFLIYSPLEFLRCTVPVFDMRIFYCVGCEWNSRNFFVNYYLLHCKGKLRKE